MAGITALGKDAFLNLLTKQLQFQDPLKPMDSTEFVAQLAQFRALESAMETNKTLSDLVQGTAAMNNLGAANLLGRKVEVFGGKLSHISGQSENVAYQLDGDASEVVIQVVDQNKNIVKMLGDSAPQKKGMHQVLWDGTDKAGNKVPSGIYTYVSVAKYDDGKLTPVKVSAEGEVSGVSYGEGGPFVTVNGVSIPIKDIVKVVK
jgi:flagellar basal-body rod modification protein FlgD